MNDHFPFLRYWWPQVPQTSRSCTQSPPVSPGRQPSQVSLPLPASLVLTPTLLLLEPAFVWRYRPRLSGCMAYTFPWTRCCRLYVPPDTVLQAISTLHLGSQLLVFLSPLHGARNQTQVVGLIWFMPYPLNHLSEMLRSSSFNV